MLPPAISLTLELDSVAANRHKARFPFQLRAGLRLPRTRTPASLANIYFTCANPGAVCGPLHLGHHMRQ